ncbi:CsbD family protein [Synechococcus sp. CS-602]|uniref:CsbD family protein n=1 Tax=Synechococcaceae TaxID=1890426 RepID=UPI0008FF43FF|nr:MULTISPECIES: CsbD family protein [Synechococcaceae]MCT4364660.1 CsbD family protein [Candidatus Regnicoccus frigidus MAG-AL1]APD47761.1 CsbD family protein [Synechococcus sp. SynAce01]MCT0202825.1 CsbD family protein [Synechococcus sp. CS-603]MCT0204815.1 CsbD family protein [Synechococcus sp. CS-602]MCT0245051.1 CsbD family protein [Synechococcus sp. CS-601]
MGLGNKAQATAKDIEGKAQETLGKVTDDEQNKLAGKAKQAQAKGEHAIEDAKD